MVVPGKGLRSPVIWGRRKISPSPIGRYITGRVRGILRRGNVTLRRRVTTCRERGGGQVVLYVAQGGFSIW